jgi:hypothetical protein
MHVRGHTGNSTRQNLAALRDEFFQKIRILVIDCLHGDIDPAPWHGPIGAAKCGTAFWSFRLHADYFTGLDYDSVPGLPVQSAPAQKWIVFFLFEPVWSARTFLVARRHITRRRLPKRFSFGAFKGNDFLRHECRSLLHFRGSGFLLLGIGAFLFGQAKQRSN